MNKLYNKDEVNVVFEEEIAKKLTPLNKYRNKTVAVHIAYIIAGLIPPFLVGMLIDDLANLVGSTAYFLIGSIVGLLLVCFVLNWLHQYMWAHVLNDGAGIVRSFLFEKMLHKNYRFFRDRHVGDITSKIINDAALFAKSKVVMMPTLIINTLYIVVVFVLLFVINAYMMLMTLILFALLVFLYSRINGRMRNSAAEERESFAKLMAEANETLSGTGAIQEFRVEGFFSKRFTHSVHLYEKLLNRLKLWQTLSKSGTDAITGILPVAAILAGIIYLFYGGGITVGNIVAFYYFLPRLSEPIKSLTDFNIDRQNANAVEAGLKMLYDQDIEANEDQSGLEKIESIDSLEFKDLSYTHPDGEKVIDDLNLKIKRGDILVISGPSGAGKTTLLRMLKRQVNPTGGTLLINGKDSQKLDKQSCIRQITTLAQDVFIFDASLQQNISFGRELPEISIRNAAQTSAIDHFSLDENALALSGGERRKLALARVLASDFDVLILDEPTANIDTETESEIIERLRGLRERTNCIIVIVTHSEAILDALCTIELSIAKGNVQFICNRCNLCRIAGQQSTESTYCSGYTRA